MRCVDNLKSGGAELRAMTNLIEQHHTDLDNNTVEWMHPCWYSCLRVALGLVFF